MQPISNGTLKFRLPLRDHLLFRERTFIKGLHLVDVEYCKTLNGLVYPNSEQNQEIINFFKEHQTNPSNFRDAEGNQYTQYINNMGFPFLVAENVTKESLRGRVVAQADTSEQEIPQFEIGSPPEEGYPVEKQGYDGGNGEFVDAKYFIAEPYWNEASRHICLECSENKKIIDLFKKNYPFSRQLKDQYGNVYTEYYSDDKNPAIEAITVRIVDEDFLDTSSEPITLLEESNTPVKSGVFKKTLACVALAVRLIFVVFAKVLFFIPKNYNPAHLVASSLKEFADKQLGVKAPSITSTR